MTCRFISSYMPECSAFRWLRGNHHGHSTRSDGEDDPFEILAAYEAAGYEYIALSEHDLLVDPEAYRAATALTVLPAVEVTSTAEQTLMVLGAAPPIPEARRYTFRALSERVARRGGLFIADHPNWFYRPLTRHVDLQEVLAAPAVGAIEIYTGVIERLPGDPYALDFWDTLLSRGRRIHGHAVDDQHAVIDRFLGWNCVQWPVDRAVTADGVIEALRDGRFYASTGVTLRDVGVSDEGRRIVIRSDADSIRWIVRDGRLAHVTPGGDGSLSLAELAEAPRLNRPWQTFRVPDEMVYVRAELVGGNGRRAWTQPFFIERDPPQPA